MWPFKRTPKSGLSHIEQIKEIEKLGYQLLSFDYKKIKGRKQFVVEFQGQDGQIVGMMWIDSVTTEEWKKIMKYCHYDKS